MKLVLERFEPAMIWDTVKYGRFPVGSGKPGMSSGTGASGLDEAGAVLNGVRYTCWRSVSISDLV